jgi:integrase
MTADYGLPIDPCANVEAISTKGHRTYTFEEPNSFSVDELSTFFELVWEKYPQHFAVILLGSVTGLRPSSLYALRRNGDHADVKWDQGLVLIRRSRGIKGRVMEMTKTNHDQVIKLPDFVMSVLRWHVDKQLTTREMERSELLFPSDVGTFRNNSTLAKPFRVLAGAMGLVKQISPKATRRSFQDAMREAQVANVVVRSISGHLTEQMQQRYSTARGHEQESPSRESCTSPPSSNGSGPAARPDGPQSGQHRGTAQGERVTGAHEPAYFPLFFVGARGFEPPTPTVST